MMPGGHPAGPRLGVPKRMQGPSPPPARPLAPWSHARAAAGPMHTGRGPATGRMRSTVALSPRSCAPAARAAGQSHRHHQRPHRRAPVYSYCAARPRPPPAPGPPAQLGRRLLYASAPPAPPGRGLFRPCCRPMQPAGQARQAGSAIQVDFPHAAGVCYSAIRGRPQATCLWSPVINKIQQGNEP